MTFLTVNPISVLDRCYIPLLRATDNSSQPIIGAPWSPEPSESFAHSLSPRHGRSPMDPLMTVKAFAGPLSPSKVRLCKHNRFHYNYLHSLLLNLDLDLI